MARAFGDFQLKNYGVIAIPQVSYRQLTSQDQFIVLATDGVMSFELNAIPAKKKPYNYFEYFMPHPI